MAYTFGVSFGISLPARHLHGVRPGDGAPFMAKSRSILAPVSPKVTALMGERGAISKRRHRHTG